MYYWKWGHTTKYQIMPSIPKKIVLIFPDLYFNGNLEWFSPRSVPGSLTERPFLGKVLSSLSNGFLIWATKRHEIEKEGLGFEDFTSSSTKKKVKVHGEHFCKYGAGLKVCKYQSHVQTSSEVWSWTPSVGNTSSSIHHFSFSQFCDKRIYCDI